jgi:hypothetical protein
MRKGSRTLAPFLVKLQQYVDTWAAAAEHVVVEPLLHDDDDWRVYLQGYTNKTRTRVTYASPPNPRLDLVLASVYPYRRDQTHNILVSSFTLIQIKSLSVRNVVPTLTSDKRQGLSLNGRCQAIRDTEFILVPAEGPYVQQWRARGTILLSTGGACSGAATSKAGEEAWLPSPW